MSKKVKVIWIIVCVIYLIIIPIIIAIIHSIVMGKYTYAKYDSDKYLLYADIADKYPREEIKIPSGNNILSAYLYGKENTKGVIVVAPGHGDSNDIKLYEVRYFVDAGYQVLGFDYTGCYTSEGKRLGGYTQAVYDLDSILTYCDNNDSFSNLPIYLFGHSMGGYAVTTILNFEHRVDAVVSASGFNSASEQWECSVKRFIRFAYPIIRPLNLAFIYFEYGEDKDLSAIDGINTVDIPVLVISADKDVFYNEKRSAIYEKRDLVKNKKCKFMLMNKPNHNEHYTYFLTDAALQYQKSNPSENIDKELYMEHDEQILSMIINFFDTSR